MSVRDKVWVKVKNRDRAEIHENIQHPYHIPGFLKVRKANCCGITDTENFIGRIEVN